MKHIHAPENLSLARGRRAWIARAGLLAVLSIGLAPAQAQDAKPLQIVVPYGPGVGVDALARSFSDSLRAQAGRTAIVVNRGGAGGVIGTSSVVRAPADGSTVLLHAHPPYGTAPLFMEQPAYDARKSLIPVAKVGSVPMVMVTSTKTPIQDFEQLRKFAQANPQRATYVSSGIGSPGQIYTEMIKSVTPGLELREIRYANPAQGQVDVISGEVLVSMISLPAAKPHLQAGTLRLLAVGSAKRVPEFPQVPTVAEVTGKPDMQAGIAYAFFAPAGTPADVVNQLHEDLAKAYTAPGLKTWLEQNSVSGQLQGPAEFAKWLQGDLEAITKLVQATGLAAAGAGATK